MLILCGPILLLLISLLSLVLLLRRKFGRGIAKLCIALIMNIWLQIVPLHPDHRNCKYDLRVASFNIDCLGSGEKKPGWKAQLIDFIESTDPDILFLPEFQYHDFGGFTDLLDSIQTTRFYGRVISVEYGRKDVVYSKYPISDFRAAGIDRQFCKSDEEYWNITDSTYQLLGPMNYLMTVELDGLTAQLVCCHLASNETWLTGQRYQSAGLFRTRWEQLKAVEKGSRFRSIEALSVREQLDYSKPILLLGDLNDLSKSEPVRILSNGKLTDAWWEKGCGYGHTYYRHGLLFRIDHVLHSHHFECVQTQVIHNEASDHYPIIADFRIKQNK